MEDAYYTIENAATAEIKVKGSRFIGHAALTETLAEADAFIAEISKKHYNATHNCTAYRVGLGDQSVFRFNDDGEPSGTAGKPILDAIDGRDLTHITCVVTRYYGGTKLGCGGLVRAYGQAAAEALDKAGRQTCHILGSVTVEYAYTLTGTVMHVIEKYEGSITASEYDENARQQVAFKQSRIDTFVRDLTEATAGKVTVIREALT